MRQRPEVIGSGPMIISGLLKQVLLQLIRNDLDRPLTPNPAIHGQMPSADDPACSSKESEFLADIAHLPVDEQQHLIQQRLWYIRLAQRQGVVEAERQPARYWGADEQPSRLYQE